MLIVVSKPVTSAHAFAIRGTPIPMNLVKPIIHSLRSNLISPSSARSLSLANSSMLSLHQSLAGLIQIVSVFWEFGLGLFTWIMVFMDTKILLPER